MLAFALMGLCITQLLVLGLTCLIKQWVLRAAAALSMGWPGPQKPDAERTTNGGTAGAEDLMEPEPGPERVPLGV